VSRAIFGWRGGIARGARQHISHLAGMAIINAVTRSLIMLVARQNCAKRSIVMAT